MMKTPFAGSTASSRANDPPTTLDPISPIFLAQTTTTKLHEKLLPETSSSEPDTRRGPDCSYTSTTTIEKPQHSFANETIPHSPSDPNTHQDCPTDEITFHTRRRFKLRGFKLRATRLKTFNREIGEPIKHRFRDIIELYERPLHDYLSKAVVNFGVISIKLRVLGESEETAKPWIVIFCDKEVSKRVKKFFNRPMVKKECQHPDSAPDLPSFEVLVHDRAPRLYVKTAIRDIYGQSWGNRNTLCGALVRVNEYSQVRKATIGGIVGVTTPAKGLTMYGMTVGHIVVRGVPRGEGLIPEDSNEEDEEDEEDQVGEYILDDEDLHDATSNNQTTGETHQEPAYPTDVWSKIGRILVPACMDNLDWALVELDNPLDYRPNFLAMPDLKGPTRVLQDLEASLHVGMGDEVRRDVIVLTGTEGHRPGTLSTFPSFLMLAPGRKFVDTYDLILSDGSGKV
ncbi:MAG: hypothetical protein M1813_004167 [Trichoglossum hirsutum]|nr:MAG: hypothetical protein M1813_004167 [Trichoglossum hirsutum]